MGRDFGVVTGLGVPSGYAYWGFLGFVVLVCGLVFRLGIDA